MLAFFSDKTHGGTLCKNLRCQEQKGKFYASGRDCRGQTPNRRPSGVRPARIEGRQQVGHWECDTVTGVNHKQAIVTVVELENGYADIGKVSSTTAHLVGQAMNKEPKPFEATVKTLTYDNGKEFCGHALIDEMLGRMGYFGRPFASWERGFKENFNGLLRE